MSPTTEAADALVALGIPIDLVILADLGDRVDGYPIVTDHNCEGMLIVEHRELSGLDDEGVAAVVLGAIQRGSAVGSG